MAVIGNELTNVRSSFVFEIFLYVNRWVLLVWLLVESLSFVYKNAILLYPSQGQIAGEIILMLCVFFIDLGRMEIGSISNRIESIWLAVLTILITIAIFFGYLYFIVWQIFVIRAELIMTIIAIVFTAIGIVFMILCIAFFARPSSLPPLYRQMPYRTTM